MTMILSGTNGGTFPSWTTAGRPASPAVGQMGYNTTTGAFDVYTASGWSSVVSSTSAQSPSAIAGNGPSVSAYGSSGTSLTNGVSTVIVLNTEVWDTNNNFNNTGSTVGGVPAYSFLPTVAGYYMVTWGLGFPAFTNTGNGEVIGMLYKNGSVYEYGSDFSVATAAHYSRSNGSCMVYLNGTTDYLTLWGYQLTGNTLTTVPTNNWTSFTAFLARTA